MATELCPAETNVSRIPFTHDFCSSSSTTFPMQQYRCPLPSTSASSLPLNSSNFLDFEFDVKTNNIDPECYSSADELFSKGKILPLQIKKRVNSPSKQDQEHEHPTPRKPQPQAKSAGSKDFNVAKEEIMSNQNQSDSRSSFWQFKRSRSLNFVTGYKKILRSSSKVLPRSSSAGSAPKAKAGPVLKDAQKEKFCLPFLQSSTSKPKSHWKKSSTYESHCSINQTLNFPLADVFCVNAVFLTGKGKKKCQPARPL